jgi:hypothetical protein
VCHTPGAGFALGFNTPQLNRDYSYAGGSTNQIEALSLAGYFSNTVSNRYLLATMAHATNETVSLEYRVRSYLAANCVQCHQPGGHRPGPVGCPDHHAWPAERSHQRPVLQQSGQPQQPRHRPRFARQLSTLSTRRQSGRGPHAPARHIDVVNTQAVALLAAWITNDLPSYVSYASWQSNYFGSTNAGNAAQLADPDSDGAKNYLEYLTGTVPTNATSGWKVSIALQQQSGSRRDSACRQPRDGSSGDNESVEFKLLVRAQSAGQRTLLPRNQPHHRGLRAARRDAEILSRPRFRALNLRRRLMEKIALEIPGATFNIGSDEFIQVPSPPRHVG